MDEDFPKKVRDEVIELNVQDDFDLDDMVSDAERAEFQSKHYIEFNIDKTNNFRKDALYEFLTNCVVFCTVDYQLELLFQ